MNGLLKRVDKIKKETVDANDKNKQLNADGTTDAFTLLRRKIGLDIKGTRELIKERDEAETSMPGSVRTVDLSHRIRVAFKEIETEIQKLQRMYEKAQDRYNKKNKQNSEKLKDIELQKEICQLAWAHFKELENQNRKRGGETSNFIPRDHQSSSTVKQLPDIDNDDFKELIRNDNQINKILDKIKDDLIVTGNIAKDMKKAAEGQSAKLDDLSRKADDLDTKLENINTRLAKMIKDVRKGDRFIIDVILICVLLGIGGFIYSRVK
ncbi:hypothetical protein CYY_008692 [Polysphondylium violaceum]|uniref:t-SNARE coiled-coil homology domain-containing protein n=1 Tax=Polysphondylium violaceum TaxID=133409 RepID=A0A8J4UWR3_9MYCE|nr:hypothetical protein CYY_008692 [Polysphondylium violaceum]